jgi:hypothetical protein
MDVNFIIFFVFLLIVIEYIAQLEDGHMLIIFGFFMLAIFANTQSASPIFFLSSDYAGWGRLFNVFWIILALICFVKSYVSAKNHGLFKVG